MTPITTPLTATEAFARIREMLELAPRCEGDITSYGGYDSLSVWMDDIEALLKRILNDPAWAYLRTSPGRF